MLIDQIDLHLQAGKSPWESVLESAIVRFRPIMLAAHPYHSINPAIRSRCQIIEVKPLTQEDIIQGLHHALDSEKGYHHLYQCDEEVLQHILVFHQEIFVLHIIV